MYVLMLLMDSIIAFAVPTHFEEYSNSLEESERFEKAVSFASEGPDESKSNTHHHMDNEGTLLHKKLSNPMIFN